MKTLEKLAIAEMTNLETGFVTIQNLAYFNTIWGDGFIENVLEGKDNNFYAKIKN